MDFSIILDTAGAKVAELGAELRKLLENEINNKYSSNKLSIGIAIRCLPKSYNRRSFVRYTKTDNYLTIDFCVIVEEYENKYKIEQRFELGQTFMSWLEKGLSNKRFIENNPDFNSDDFLNTVKKIGQTHSWFQKEIDWSLDLDQSEAECFCTKK